MSRTILISAFWLLSLVGAFFGGRLMEKTTASAASPAQVRIVPSMLDGKDIGPKSGANPDDGGGQANNNNGGKKSVKALIAQVRAALQGGMPMMNPSAMMKAMAPFADLSLDEVKEALKEINETIKAPQQKMMLNSVLVGRLAETDGPGAIAYVDENLKDMGPMAQGVRVGAYSTWAQSDPEGAWEYYKKNKSEEDDSRGGLFGGNQMMLSTIFAGMAGEDLDLAMTRLDDLDDSERAMAIAGLASGSAWDETRRDSLLAATNTMSATDKAQVRQTLVSQWAMFEPEAALDWAAELPAEERDQLLPGVTGPLMMTNPKQGAEILLKFASEEQKPKVYADVIGQWASNDPNGAGEWLGAQAQGPELDEARSRFATTIAGRDPESAMAWARTITDTDSRLNAVQQTYIQWSQSDADAANNALQNSGLTAEQIEAIRPISDAVAPTER